MLKVTGTFGDLMLRTVNWSDAVSKHDALAVRIVRTRLPVIASDAWPTARDDREPNRSYH